jgi:hypothetical protein
MTTKFLSPNIRELLGVTPVCTVSDRQIWNRLVTPMTKALLGKIVGAEVSVRETVAGAFPGDEVTNLNDHKLYGGQDGFVRNRYVATTYRTENGLFIIKRDGVKFKAFGWFGDPRKGLMELIFKGALRDRRFDGTKQANDSALIDFIGYEDVSLNAPLVIAGKQVKSVELSVYAFLPGSSVADVSGDEEFHQFIRNPFTFLDRPELFRQLFDRAWKTKLAPGQVSKPVPDVSKLVVPEFEAVAKGKRYDFVENAPSHYHVALWSKSMGYRYLDPAQEKAIDELTAGIARLKAAGVKLTRPQESWLCVVQSLRPDLIPAGLNLNGPKWPQDNIGPQNLWMYKPLTEKAKALLEKK